MLTKKQQAFLDGLSVDELCQLVSGLFYQSDGHVWISQGLGLTAIMVSDELAKRVRETAI